MLTKWLAGFAVLFLILTIASNLIEGAYLGTGDVGTVWGLISSGNPKDIFIGISSMLTFNYAFFVGYWEIFRWFFVCVAGGLFISMLFQMPTWMAIVSGLIAIGVLLATIL